MESKGCLLDYSNDANNQPELKYAIWMSDDNKPPILKYKQVAVKTKKK